MRTQSARAVPVNDAQFVATSDLFAAPVSLDVDAPGVVDMLDDDLLGDDSVGDEPLGDVAVLVDGAAVLGDVDVLCANAADAVISDVATISALSLRTFIKNLRSEMKTDFTTQKSAAAGLLHGGPRAHDVAKRSLAVGMPYRQKRVHRPDEG